MNSTETHKKLAVCLYLTGERPRAALAILDNLLATQGIGKSWELLVAVDAPSYEMHHIIEREYCPKKKAVFFDSRETLGKLHWWRAVMSNIHSDYILLIDDGVNLSPSWITDLLTHARNNPSLSLCGFKHPPSTQTDSDEQTVQSPLKDGPILLRTSFLRECEKLPRDQASNIAAQTTFFDSSMAGSLGIFPDVLGPLSLEGIFHRDSIGERSAPLNADRPLISICVCTYGHHPELILRCLDSILRDPLMRKEVEILVGCNNASDEVVHEIERRHKGSAISTLIRSPVNYNKSGMQRFLFRIARAPYILSLDDDMYFKPGWWNHMKQQVVTNHPFEASGRLHALSNRSLWSGKKKPYDSFCQKKSWWRGKRPHGVEVVFPAGQCFLVRTDFVLDNDYPDLDMRIDWDDVLLGDMVTQLDGKLAWFSEQVMKAVVVDDIPSRGKHGGG